MVNFVMADHAKIGAYWEDGNSKGEPGRPLQSIMRGGRFESVTVGKMPDRQVILYSKCATLPLIGSRGTSAGRRLSHREREFDALIPVNDPPAFPSETVPAGHAVAAGPRRRILGVQGTVVMPCTKRLPPSHRVIGLLNVRP